MKRYDFALLWADKLVLLLKTRYHTFNRILKVLHLNHILATPGSKQCGFVTEVRQLRPGKTRCLRSKYLQIDILRKGQLLGMNLQDTDTSVQIRFVDQNLPVKTDRKSTRLNSSHVAIS